MGDGHIIDQFTRLVNSKKDKEAINYTYHQLTVIYKMVRSYVKTVRSSAKTNNYNKRMGSLSKFISGVHQLISRSKSLVLREKDEIKHPLTNINYLVTVANSGTKLKLFVLYTLVYCIEAANRVHLNKASQCCLNSKPHVGLDYEFNKGKIALMQANFETYADKKAVTNSYIWLLNPDELDSSGTKVLIKCLMTNLDIYKILQGAESLDVPYMYDTMFNGNQDVIKRFTKKLIDTKYLCEYYKLSLDKVKKCNIYDALRDFGTISPKVYNKLIQTHEGMGPVQHVRWDVHQLDKFRVKYALYDVLFLKHYLIDIYTKISKHTDYLVPTYGYVNPIVRWVYLERRGVTKIVEEARALVNLTNNYRFKAKGTTLTLITAYNTVIENFKVPLDNGQYIDISFLLEIGFLKNVLNLLFKKVVYYLISQSYQVYQNKDQKIKGRISMKPTYLELNKEGFDRVAYLLTLFQKEAKKKIYYIYR